MKQNYKINWHAPDGHYVTELGHFVNPMDNIAHVFLFVKFETIINCISECLKVIIVTPEELMNDYEIYKYQQTTNSFTNELINIPYVIKKGSKILQAKALAEQTLEKSKINLVN